MKKDKKKKKKLRFNKKSDVERDRQQYGTARLVIGLSLDLLLLIMALVLVVKLFDYANETKFFTDECFHNYIIRSTSESWKVPSFLPDIYSGKPNIEPPLFHWIGAMFRGIFSVGAMPYFNIFLFIVLLILMYIFIRFHFHANAARLSLLIMMTPPFMHQFSLAFYIEMLSSLTFFLGIFLLLLAINKKKYSFYVYAGLGGVAVLVSKISGIVILPFYFIIFVYYGIRYLLKKGPVISVTGSVLTVAVALIGSMLFFVVATEKPLGFANRTFIRPVQTLVLPKILGDSSKSSGEDGKNQSKPMKSREHFTVQKKVLIQQVFKGMGRLLIAGLIIALIHALISLGRSKTLWVLIFFIYAFLVFLFTPAAQPRHFIALIPLAAFLGGYAVYDLGVKLWNLVLKWKNTRGTCILKEIGFFSVLGFITFFIISAVIIKNVPSYRTGLLRGKPAGIPAHNIPPSLFQPIEFIRENTPEDSLVFTMWAYSTLYHGERQATWGANARGMKDIYFVDKTKEFVRRCKEEGITHFLVDNNRIWPEARYNTVVFTNTMIDHLLKLMRNGRAELLWPPIRPELVEKLVLAAAVPPDKEQIRKNASYYALSVATPQGLKPFSSFYVIRMNYGLDDSSEQDGPE